MTAQPQPQLRFVSSFNGPVEIGLRTLTILTEAYPNAYSLEHLVIFDYLLVHSDDLPNGPAGLHPKTPHRSGELLVRRNVLMEGMLLYQSRGLLERRFEDQGIFFSATDYSAGFLDALSSTYVLDLRKRAEWLVNSYGQIPRDQLEKMIREHIGEWEAEFELESVLWAEDMP